MGNSTKSAVSIKYDAEVKNLIGSLHFIESGDVTVLVMNGPDFLLVRELVFKELKEQGFTFTPYQLNAVLIGNVKLYFKLKWNKPHLDRVPEDRLFKI